MRGIKASMSCSDPSNSTRHATTCRNQTLLHRQVTTASKTKCTCMFYAGWLDDQCFGTRLYLKALLRMVMIDQKDSCIVNKHV